MNSINFIVDIGVGKTIEQWLLKEGYSIISTSKLNHELADKDIIALAIKHSSIIITMDKDFGELVFKDMLIHCGILLLRLEDAVAEEKLAALQNILPKHINELTNNFCVYQNGKFRTRK
jgi:predicted nuclease of predicted toxin-antitoxin system